MKARGIVPVVLALAVAAGVTACGGSEKVGTSVASPHLGRVSPAVGPVGSTVIRTARRSSAIFKIFPPRASTVACLIPHGGAAAGRFRGTCTSEIRTSAGPGPNPLVEVVFTERWHYRGNTGRWWHTTWLLGVRHGRVIGTSIRGSGPPQFWL
jgi:hypothetical protein